MSYPINMVISGSALIVSGSTVMARAEINVPLTCSLLSLGTITVTDATIVNDLLVTGGITGSLSGTFTGGGIGSFNASEGLSGSLQEVSAGVPYVVSALGVHVTTQSNGSVLITASSGSLASTDFTVPREARYVVFSGTSGHVTASLPTEPFVWEEHVFKDGDGSSPTNNIIISASGGRIDGGFGHEISSSYGSARLVFVGSGLWHVV